MERKEDDIKNLKEEISRLREGLERILTSHHYEDALFIARTTLEGENNNE